MKQLTQTDTTPTTGNCLPTCIASILEISPETVPNEHGDDWAQKLNKWLRLRGLRLYRVELPANLKDASQEVRAHCLPGYCILAAQSPRFDCLHSVVVLDGEIVHDPHPEREMGVGEWKFVDFLLALDPKKGHEPFVDEIRYIHDFSVSFCEHAGYGWSYYILRPYHGPFCQGENLHSNWFETKELAVAGAISRIDEVMSGTEQA